MRTSSTPLPALGVAGFLALNAVAAAADTNINAQTLLRSPGGDRPEIAAQYDTNKDGVLNKTERDAARQALQSKAKSEALDALKQQDKDGDGKVSRNELEQGRRNPLRSADANDDGFVEEAEAIASVFRGEAYETMLHHPGAERIAPFNQRNTGSGLYDTATLRTFFLEFDDDDWLAEMHDFYHSDISVPADLIVDGERYEDVGVQYRGNSSFFQMAPDRKRSFNIAMDLSKKGGDLYGYETLNLHNGAEDPTFMREVLYSRICRDYMPAFQANFAKVVINGESWGIYLNVQQYNSDFVDQWFGSKKGVRWKVSGGPGKKGLSYEGADESAYQGYALKTSDAPETALANLIHLCRVLGETPDSELEAALQPIFDIDGALWSLALENIFVDEGYVIRISDYNIFQDKNGRFHLLQHDGNEVFNVPHGPGLPRGFDATQLDPFHNIENRDYAVIHRLLNIPNLRARYIAHMRTILDEWFRWDRLEPVIQSYRALITTEVYKDVRKLYSDEDYNLGVLETVGQGGTLGIKQFVDRRREFLLSRPALVAPAPEIVSVSAKALGGEPVQISATVSDTVPVTSVVLHWSSKRNDPYTPVRLQDDGAHGDGAANDGVYGGVIPPQAAGSRFQYYVEARAGTEEMVSTFHPAKAEAAALTVLVP